MIQILIDDHSTREDVTSVLRSEYELVRTDEVVRAELYVTDDLALPTYREQLEKRKREASPVLCPVVVIKRQSTPLDPDASVPQAGHRGGIADDIVPPSCSREVLLCTVANLLDHRQSTKKLVQRNTEIEASKRELREYQRRIETQRDELQRLNQILCHDIRNDLQVIQTYAELLESRLDGPNHEYVANILESTDSAVELTTEVHDHSTAVLGHGDEQQTVSLAPTLENEVDSVDTVYRDATVELDGDIPRVEVVADAMLGSVFRNLLTNAVVHNDTGQPQVTVSVAENTEDVEVRIADNGPGISPDKQEELFSEGAKGTESDGTGIGLYLVKTLVEQYNGEITIEANEPRGTIFVIRLLRP